MDVAVISPADVWAVGARSATSHVPLALHWDGTRWSEFQPPTHRTDYPAQLLAVSASGPHDVWAVGVQVQPFAVHWNGARWTRVRLAPREPSRRPYRFWDIAAISPADAWLLGQANRQPVVEHWDGERWARVPTPAVPTGLNGSALHGLAVVSATDVWAVGSQYGYQESERGCLVEHWDGTRWSLVDCPAPEDAYRAWLNAATVVAPDDIWAVGAWTERQKGTVRGETRTLVVHWDGVAWSLMPAPDQAPLLRTLAARSGSDILAPTGNPEATLVRWDGSRWHAVALTPFVASGRPIIAGLATASDGHVWAVGSVLHRDRTGGLDGTRYGLASDALHPLVLVGDPWTA
jgi:hypothetical protein